jgi:hypothetical protein
MALRGGFADHIISNPRPANRDADQFAPTINRVQIRPAKDESLRTILEEDPSTKS